MDDLDKKQTYFVHPSSFVEQPCEIGKGTKIWHYSHVMNHSKIGEQCVLGQNVFVASHVVVGDRCHIQNNVSLFEGVLLEDEVFCGPSMVFTNVANPRSGIDRKGEYQQTLVKRGATIGANATILCGITLGRHSFIAAGAVVISDVPDYGLMMGVPAIRKGWVSRHGHRLSARNSDGVMICPESGWRYKEVEPLIIRCLDWPEDTSLNLAEALPGHGET